MRFDVMPVATEKQILQIEEAAGHVWHNYYKDIMSPEQIEYMLKKFQSKEAVKKQMSEGYIYYMLLADNHLAGYLCVLLQNDSLLIDKLFIKAEYRRQGLAKKVMAHLDNIFTKPDLGFTHIQKMRALIERNNHFALNVYEHLGFVKLRPVDTDIGEGFVCQDYLMERPVREHGE